MNQVSPSRWLVERALEMGFDAVGIVPLQAPPHLEQFRQWLFDLKGLV